MSVPNNMETGVWLLMGLTGSTQGVLEMKDSMISFTAYGQGALYSGRDKFPRFMMEIYCW